MIKSMTTTKKKSQGNNTRQFIILHHTWQSPETTTKAMVDYLSVNEKAQVSCHYVVWIDWSVHQIGTEYDILRHAWQSSWKWLTDMNRYSIGIEVCWPFYNLPNTVWWFTQEQRNAVWWLIVDIARRNWIPKENILRHADIAPWRKTDITPDFYAPLKWNEYVDHIFNTYNIKKMSNQTITNEEHIKMLIQNYMNLWSILWNNIQDEQIKKALADTNALLRLKWFNNKK